MRSKAHWGYDATFMDAMKTVLRQHPDDIERWPYYVLADANGTIGFFSFRNVEGNAFLHDMWIDTAYIGRGYGRAMWVHALERAGALGYFPFTIESDPNAESFYLAMGARRIGTRISTESGRTLPLLEMTLS